MSVSLRPVCLQSVCQASQDYIVRSCLSKEEEERERREKKAWMRMQQSSGLWKWLSKVPATGGSEFGSPITQTNKNVSSCVRDRRIPEASWPASFTKLVSTSVRALVSKNKVDKNRGRCSVLTSGLHLHAHACLHAQRTYMAGEEHALA